VKELFEHALEYLSDSDMMGITIQNRVNQNDKPIGINFRRKDKLAGNVIWSVFEIVSRSNSRFNALDTLIVKGNSIRMLVGFGKQSPSLSVMANLKRSIVEVNAEGNCLANEMIIAIAKAESVLNYVHYRRCYMICPVVQNLLATTVIDLSGGGASLKSSISRNTIGTITYLPNKAWRVKT